MQITTWSHGQTDPAAREGNCPRCGEALDDGQKTMKVEGAWVHRRCLRPGDAHPYAPREEQAMDDPATTTQDRAAQELTDDLFEAADELATDGEGWFITGERQVIVAEGEAGDFTLYVSRDHYDDDEPVRRFRVRIEEVPDGTD